MLQNKTITEYSMKTIKWQGYTVEITKKNVKNTNLRLKPSDPQENHISIPCSVSYASVMQFLEQPKTIHWLQRIQKKFRENPVNPASKDSISVWLGSWINIIPIGAPAGNV
jgi:hypothetical protein